MSAAKKEDIILYRWQRTALAHRVVGKESSDRMGRQTATGLKLFYSDINGFYAQRRIRLFKWHKVSRLIFQQNLLPFQAQCPRFSVPYKRYFLVPPAVAEASLRELVVGMNFAYNLLEFPENDIFHA